MDLWNFNRCRKMLLWPTIPLAIVIGNESKGISELVKKNCDFVVKIPMQGKITSLNASVSAGIVVYETLKQRIKINN